MAQATLTSQGIAWVSCHIPAPMRASVMTPIVFWASFVPCDSDTRDAVPICPHLKPALA